MLPSRVSCSVNLFRVLRLTVALTVLLVGGTSLSLRVFVPEPSNFVCIASNARSSLRRPYTLPRTEPPPHPRPLLPSSPKQTRGYAGVAFSIPRGAPIESDQSDGSLSFHLANPFQSSRSLASIEASPPYMQKRWPWRGKCYGIKP